MLSPDGRKSLADAGIYKPRPADRKRPIGEFVEDEHVFNAILSLTAYEIWDTWSACSIEFSRVVPEASSAGHYVSSQNSGASYY